MRGTALIVGAAGIGLAAAAPAAADDPLACLPRERGAAGVAAVVAGDVLDLDDGRRIRLAGIAAPRAPLGGTVPSTAGDGGAPGDGIAADAASASGTTTPDPADDPPDVPTELRAPPARAAAPPAPGAGGPAEAARAALGGLSLGRRVTVHPAAPEPDRHGRLVAHLVVEGDDAPLAARLVAAGHARVVPAPRETACLDRLLALEGEARAGRRGLWAGPDFAVLAADDPDLARRAGRFALVEGLVRSTGRAGGLRYLNFGEDFRSDFTAVIDDKEVGRFERAGVAPDALRGKVVRLRGWLAVRDGGFMRLTLPEEIEWVR